MNRVNGINKAAHEYCEKSIPNLQDIYLVKINVRDAMVKDILK